MNYLNDTLRAILPVRPSCIGLGCWAIGGPFWDGNIPLGWGDVDDAESLSALQTGIERGINFIDTADVYGAGHSEKIVSQVLATNRESLILASKFGNVFDETSKQVTGQNADPAYIRHACEHSLRRLKTDYIDILQFHIGDYPPEQAVPVRDTLEELVHEQKIRSYAWSTDSPERATVFAQGMHCSAVQFQQNVLDDKKTMTTLIEQEHLIGILRGPLAMGLLSGKYSTHSITSDSDVRGKNAPEWMEYFKDGKARPEFLQKLESIREILTSKNRTLVQGALAWLWARSDNFLPIPGFRTASQVNELIDAVDSGPLESNQMQEIENILKR